MLFPDSFITLTATYTPPTKRGFMTNIVIEFQAPGTGRFRKPIRASFPSHQIYGGDFGSEEESDSRYLPAETIVSPFRDIVLAELVIQKERAMELEESWRGLFLLDSAILMLNFRCREQEFYVSEPELYFRALIDRADELILRFNEMFNDLRDKIDESNNRMSIYRYQTPSPGFNPNSEIRGVYDCSIRPVGTS